jgi:hypothetical protein
MMPCQAPMRRVRAPGGAPRAVPGPSKVIDFTLAHANARGLAQVHDGRCAKLVYLTSAVPPGDHCSEGDHECQSGAGKFSFFILSRRDAVRFLQLIHGSPLNTVPHDMGSRSLCLENASQGHAETMGRVATDLCPPLPPTDLPELDIRPTVPNVAEIFLRPALTRRMRLGRSPHFSSHPPLSSIPSHHRHRCLSVMPS